MKLTTQAPSDVIRGFRQSLSTKAAIDELQAALPEYAKRYMTGERLSRIALNCIAKTPALLKCDARAVFRCLNEAAMIGIEPSAGGSMPQAYLIPYERECSLVVTWQGWVSIARRSKAVEQISARCVYAADFFSYSHGLDGLEFEHKPHLGDDERGDLCGAYCIWKCDGVWDIRYMSRADLEARKKASAAGDRGPWGKWFDEMCLKTVIKSAAKWWPKPMDAIDALDHLDAVDRGERIIDADDLVAAPPVSAKESLMAKIAGKSEDPPPPPPDPIEFEKKRDEEFVAALERANQRGNP